MSLRNLFERLADVCDDRLDIEKAAQRALRQASGTAISATAGVPLPEIFKRALLEPTANPVSRLISDAKLPWKIPETSDDPSYVADSQKKLIVELVGPDGLIPAADIRVGLYGIAPGAYYGYRTHPAEEVFVMLAGEAEWAKCDDDFTLLGPGARAYHPPMVRHATVTRDHAFMSLYVWRGDVSYAGYDYQGKNVG